jgi:hypothetical protein
LEIFQFDKPPKKLNPSYQTFTYLSVPETKRNTPAMSINKLVSENVFNPRRGHLLSTPKPLNETYRLGQSVVSVLQTLHQGYSKLKSVAPTETELRLWKMPEPLVSQKANQINQFTLGHVRYKYRRRMFPDFKTCPVFKMHVEQRTLHPNSSQLRTWYVQHESCRVGAIFTAWPPPPHFPTVQSSC